MKPENAIEVHDVRKYFKVYMDKGHMLRERIIHFNRNRYEKREVLKGISFDVRKGESVGLIGRNGCGKSTTLKLLTKILRPNGGSIDIQGRVCSLIELGAGFHPDMSGRENIYINASIFGIKAKEVDKRLNDIIRFSELEEFIDNPVRTYSSGMYMRLAFSVAINVDADILLIDEILAVGDNSFQTKCFNKLKSLKDEGTTIVIVSHALGQVEKLCDRAIWIDKGVIKEDGSARQICRNYLDYMEEDRLERAELEYRMQLEEEKKRKEDEERQKQEELNRKEEEQQKEEKRKKEERVREEAKRKEEQAKREAEEREQKKREEARRRNASCREITNQCGPDARREGSGEIHFTRVSLLNSEGKETLEFEPNEKITLEMEYEAIKTGMKANFIMGITRDDWVYCYGATSKSSTGVYYTAQKQGVVRFEVDSLKLLSGTYFLDVRIRDEEDKVYDNIYSLIQFKVKKDQQKEFGIFSMSHNWSQTDK